MPPCRTRSATRAIASSASGSERKNRLTWQPAVRHALIWAMYPRPASVVSKAKLSPRRAQAAISSIIRRPALIAAVSGAKGARPAAIRSALMKRGHCASCGRNDRANVVLPAALGPTITMTFLLMLALPSPRAMQTELPRIPRQLDSAVLDLNCQGFLDSCRWIQLPVLEEIFQRQGNVLLGSVKKLRHLELCEPDRCSSARSWIRLRPSSVV